MRIELPRQIAVKRRHRQIDSGGPMLRHLAAQKLRSFVLHHTLPTWAEPLPDATAFSAG